MFNKILMENAEINNYYWDSRLPKFIKKRICKYRRNKLRKKVDLYTDTDKYIYKSIFIYELLLYASIQPVDAFPKMKEYSFTSTVIDEPETTIIASMTYPVDKISYQFTITSKVDCLSIDIYVVDKYGKRKKLDTINDEGEGLYSVLGVRKYNETIVNIIHGLAAMLSELMYEFMNDQFTRSERIYNG